MENVQIKLLDDNVWTDTKYQSLDEAIQAVRESYKLFGITYCSLRLNGKEWDNF